MTNNSTNEKLLHGDNLTHHLSADMGNSLTAECNHSQLHGCNLGNDSTVIVVDPRKLTDDIVHDPVLIGVIVFFLILTFLMTLIGNMTILSVIFRYHDLHRSTYYLIGCYVTNDLLLCFFFHPFAITYTVMEENPLGATWCKVQAVVLMTLLLSSLHIMGLISFERYFYVDNPIYHSTVFSEWRIGTTIVTTYCVSGVVSFIVQLIYGAQYEPTNFACKTLNNNTIVFVGSLVYYIPSMLIQLYTHAEIFRATVRQRRQIDAILMAIDRHSRSIVKKLRTTQSILIVVSIYSIAWVPYIATHMYQVLNEIPAYTSQSLATVTMVSSMLLHTMSPSLSPIVFLSWNKLLRLAILKLYCRKQVTLTEVNSAVMSSDASHSQIQIYALYAAT